MSTNEQDAAVGKYMRERKEIRGQKSLLVAEISDYSRNILKVAGTFNGTWGSQQDMRYAIHEMKNIEASGGLGRLVELVNKYLDLESREEEINRALKEVEG